MIANDTKLQVTLARIVDFHAEVVSLRRVMSDVENYRLSAGGFLAEIEKFKPNCAIIRAHIPLNLRRARDGILAEPFASTAFVTRSRASA